MNDILKEEIKEFFNNNQYQVSVLHEYDKDDVKIEHFFVLYRIDQVKNKSILEEFRKHSKTQNLTNVTKNFLIEQKDNLIYLPIVSLDKTSAFYLNEYNYVKNNYNNILCLNITGQVADIESHFQNQLQNKLFNAKNIGVSIGMTTKEILDETLPIAKNKIKSLLKRFK